MGGLPAKLTRELVESHHTGPGRPDVDEQLVAMDQRGGAVAEKGGARPELLRQGDLPNQAAHVEPETMEIPIVAQRVDQSALRINDRAGVGLVENAKILAHLDGV